MNTKKNKTIQNTKRNENGDWGLGKRERGMGPNHNKQCQIPNTQTPNTNHQSPYNCFRGKITITQKNKINIIIIQKNNSEKK